MTQHPVSQTVAADDDLLGPDPPKRTRPTVAEIQARADRLAQELSHAESELQLPELQPEADGEWRQSDNGSWDRYPVKPPPDAPGGPWKQSVLDGAWYNTPEPPKYDCNRVDRRYRSALIMLHHLTPRPTLPHDLKKLKKLRKEASACLDTAQGCLDSFIAQRRSRFAVGLRELIEAQARHLAAREAFDRLDLIIRKRQPPKRRDVTDGCVSTGRNILIDGVRVPVVKRVSPHAKK